MKKKVYISIPISGRDIWEQRNRAIEVAQRFYHAGYDVVTPFDIIPIGSHIANDYATCMGEDIKELLRCDIIALVDDWESSKGCRAEAQVAAIYGLEARFVTI
jgi:uncharacterized protein YdaT